MPHKSRSYRLAAKVAIGIETWATTRSWEGFDTVPTGGSIVVSNHLSHADPITLGHALIAHGHVPRFLTKDTLFEVPGFGRILRNSGQIRVMRESTAAGEAFAEAITAIEDGEMLVIYPEGTVTRDPDLWPMRGKTGAARIALATGCPVIPVGQWGPQRIWPPFTHVPRLRRGTPVHLRVGPAVDLSEYGSTTKSLSTLIRATDQIMDAITELVAQLRQETPPDKRWNPKAHGQPLTGKLRHKRRG